MWKVERTVLFRTYHIQEGKYIYVYLHRTCRVVAHAPGYKHSTVSLARRGSGFFESSELRDPLDGLHGGWRKSVTT